MTTPTPALPPFDDHRVQIVYELICSEDHPPNKAEHWDGWVSRRIVAALEAAATAPLLERIAELEGQTYCQSCGDIATRDLPEEATGFPGPYCDNCPSDQKIELAQQDAQPFGWVSMGQIRFTPPTCDHDTYTRVYTHPAPKQVPHKIPIPPAQAEMLDVVYAEGWNQCCDTFFGGLPAQEPLVITVTEKEEKQVPLTDEMRKQMKDMCDSMEMRGAFAHGWMSAEAAHGITVDKP